MHVRLAFASKPAATMQRGHAPTQRPAWRRAAAPARVAWYARTPVRRYAASHQASRAPRHRPAPTECCASSRRCARVLRRTRVPHLLYGQVFFVWPARADAVASSRFAELGRLPPCRKALGLGIGGGRAFLSADGASARLAASQRRVAGGSRTRRSESGVGRGDARGAKAAVTAHPRARGHRRGHRRRGLRRSCRTRRRARSV